LAERLPNEKRELKEKKEALEKKVELIQ